MANGKRGQATERAGSPGKPRMTVARKIEPMESGRHFVRRRRRHLFSSRRRIGTFCGSVGCGGAAAVYRHPDAAKGGRSARPRPRPNGAMPDAQMIETIEQVECMPYLGQSVPWRGIPQGAGAIGITRASVLRVCGS